MRAVLGLAVAVGLLAVSDGAFANPAKIDPAQAMAQKFAEGGNEPPPIVPLTAKPKTPAVPPAPAVQQPAAPPQKPLDAKNAAPKPQQPPPAVAKAPPAQAAVPPKPDRPGIDYEMEMLKRARAEAEALKVSTKPAAVEPAPVPLVQPAAAAKSVSPFAPSTADVKPEPVKPNTGMSGVAGSSALPGAVAAAPASEPPAAAAPKVAGGDQAAREAQPSSATATPAIASPPPASQNSGPIERVTLLVVMEPAGKTAVKHDIIVCAGDQCFVSNGFASDAKAVALSDASVWTSTETQTLDGCRGKAACIFRNVPVPKSPRLQVIDFANAAKPAASAGYTGEIDASCKVSEGELNCDRPLATQDFRIWIVPEATAKAAPERVLEEAMAEGLPHPNVVEATDK